MEKHAPSDSDKACRHVIGNTLGLHNINEKKKKKHIAITLLHSKTDLITCHG